MVTINDEPEKSIILAMFKEIIDVANNYGIITTSSALTTASLYKYNIYYGLIFYHKGSFNILIPHSKTIEISISNPNWLNEIKSSIMKLVRPR